MDENRPWLIHNTVGCNKNGPTCWTLFAALTVIVVTVFVNGRYLGGFIFALYLVSVYGALCLVVVDILL